VRQTLALGRGDVQFAHITSRIRKKRVQSNHRGVRDLRTYHLTRRGSKENILKNATCYLKGGDFCAEGGGTFNYNKEENKKTAIR